MPGGLLEVEAYLARVLGLADGFDPPVESVSLAAATGRVLAADLTAGVSVPPFDNSAMDGFAVRAADLASVPVVLVVVGESAAAAGPIPSVVPGTAVRVMTGGRVPPGADTVVPVELTDQPAGAAPLPAQVEVRRQVPDGGNVRRAADDLAAGDPVLPAGALITPAAVGSAASVGWGALPVFGVPRVAVVSTGAELVEPGASLAEGQLHDSNSAMVAALAAAAGAEVRFAGRSGDDPDELAALLAALPPVDLILTSGGVSAGAYEPLRLLGAGLEFVSVAMQPGKPQGYGRIGGVPLLAFPGNPVSSFVSFRVFGRPLIDALAGLCRRDRTRVGRAAEGWASPPGRRQYLPVRLDETADGTLVRASHRRGSGSHLVASLALADALAVVPAEQTVVEAGATLTLVEV
ncbi:gephyrin-like molybdotransferase Glp [Micropruina sp.]|uniref:molybdopterin molybdotransferase MoeA n=1 Tax=Micropruina sp. TaxID=2737536 RepID=UPI0039E272D6